MDGLIYFGLGAERPPVLSNSDDCVHLNLTGVIGIRVPLLRPGAHMRRAAAGLQLVEVRHVVLVTVAGDLEGS